MTKLLLGLAASIVLAASAGTAGASDSTAQPHVASAGIHKGPIHGVPPHKHTNLSSSECTQLGGKVSSDTSCNGQNKVCTVVTWNSTTNRGSTHTLCLTEP